VSLAQLVRHCIIYAGDWGSTPVIPPVLVADTYPVPALSNIGSDIKSLSYMKILFRM
jgi:hypothetical protein